MYFSKTIKTSLIPLLLATSYALAEETPSKEKGMLAPGYNAPCRIAVQNSYDFFVSGSFTYWQPIQENMSLGVVSNNANTLDLVNGKEIDLDLKYKPGFKVGIGMNFDYDQWDTFLQYTWFRGTQKASVNLDPNSASTSLFPAWQIPSFLDPQYSSGSEKWRLQMDLVDWDVARSCSLGTKLCFRPFFGMRAAFIRQKVQVSYINVTPSDLLVWPSTFITQSSHSWGVGPRMGLDTNWNLGQGFRLYANEELDILYTQYKLRSSQSSAVTVASQYIVKQNKANFLRAHLELKVGLGWERYFSEDRYHVDLSADYGFQVFFDQNVFRSTVSAQAIGKSFLPNGNLYMHGLTINLRFDF